MLFVDSQESEIFKYDIFPENSMGSDDAVDGAIFESIEDHADFSGACEASHNCNFYTKSGKSII